MEINGFHEDSIAKLYEASIRGCSATLESLLQRDPLIIDRIYITSSTKTPLHISSLLGHAEFTKVLLNHKPKLTAELNSQGQSPLHLAAANGHAEIVQALLSVNKDVCLVFDQYYGRIPLHIAAMRGKTEVMQLLMNACPRSVRMKSQYGQQTVLHLCVKHNHLEALKFLLSCGSINDREFLNSVDDNGNTILKLAVKMNQVKTIKYLASIPQMRVEAHDFAAISTNPYDFETMQMPIQDCRTKESVLCIQRPPDQNETAQHCAVSVPNGAQPTPVNDLIKYLDYQKSWMEKTRGNLLVGATVISSMAFQAAINPPGGVWQEEQSSSCPAGKNCKVGTAVLAYTNERAYHAFIISNTVSFSASLAVIFLLMCGLPFKNRVTMSFLMLVMCTTLLFIVATYLIAFSLTGKPEDDTITYIDVVYILFWAALLVVILVFYIVSFIFWVLKKLFMGAFRITRFICCC